MYLGGEGFKIGSITDDQWMNPGHFFLDITTFR